MAALEKEIILGVTGSIAAYKACDLAHTLTKENIGVNVVMTESATKLIAPATFEALTARQTVTDTFARTSSYDIHHIALAKRASAVIIAPATANIIAKLANGIADDALSTQVLACAAPKLVAPAMNTAMLNAPQTVANIARLKEYGYTVIEPTEGLLACGDVGAGKLADVDVLCTYVRKALRTADLLGKRVLVSAGATIQAIDPVRYITNRSTGLMGHCIAKECMLRGASVTLVTGKSLYTPPPLVDVVSVESAEQMYNSITSLADCQDIVIMTAAVADFTPAIYSECKLKKADRTAMTIELTATRDILRTLGENTQRKYKLCGFAMETDNLLENARKKLAAKNCDLIVANSLSQAGAGFAVDTNIATLISKADEISLPIYNVQGRAGDKDYRQNFRVIATYFNIFTGHYSKFI